MNDDNSSINEPFYRNARKPVSSLPILYEWHEGYEPVFDRQIETIRQDLRLARKRNKFIAYLSCPISRRGGGSKSTNVAIAEFVQNRMEAKWGGRLWVLNPAEYQMETEIGRERFCINSKAINEEWIYKKMQTSEGSPNGGDYMRMWSKILCENENGEFSYGSMFDMYLFVGANDVHEFFRREAGGDSHTANVESFLARRIASYPSFRSWFQAEDEPKEHRDNIIAQRTWDFTRFYGIRGGANYSKGCHDEWNTWVLLNRKRIMDGYALKNSNNSEYHIGSQIPGYMNGHQIGPGESETLITDGYGVLIETIQKMSETERL